MTLHADQHKMIMALVSARFPGISLYLVMYASKEREIGLSVGLKNVSAGTIICFPFEEENPKCVIFDPTFAFI